jgi:hypothetical protein
MIRRISYRAAATAFVFTGLWFVIGLVLLWSPIPSVLGIDGPMFVAWLLLLLVILAGSGAMLTLASINGVFPPAERPRARRPAPAPSVSPVAQASRTPDGKPLPWTSSPLPQRPARRSSTTAPIRPPSPGRPPAQRGG